MFSMLWTLTGVCVIAIFSIPLTSAITVETSEGNTDLTEADQPPFDLRVAKNDNDNVHLAHIDA